MGNGQDILIANSDSDEAMHLADMIRAAKCRSRSCRSLTDLMALLSNTSFLAVILDIDNLDIDNRTIRSLTLAHPDTCFLCTSSERFHPELQEALRDHIFACITKPVDPEEMLYWIRCIRENHKDSTNPPEHRPEKGA